MHSGCCGAVSLPAPFQQIIHKQKWHWVSMACWGDSLCLIAQHYYDTVVPCQSPCVCLYSIRSCVMPPSMYGLSTCRHTLVAVACLSHILNCQLFLIQVQNVFYAITKVMQITNPVYGYSASSCSFILHKVEHIGCPHKCNLHIGHHQSRILYQYTQIVLH